MHDLGALHEHRCLELGVELIELTGEVVSADASPETSLMNQCFLTPGDRKVFSLREASWVSCRDRAFVGLVVGPECAVLIVGKKFVFTRRERYQFSNYIGSFHAANSHLA